MTPNSVKFCIEMFCSMQRFTRRIQPR